MITCEVIKQFTLGQFDQLINIKRRSVEKYGTLYVGDQFQCDLKMAKYLTGNNEKSKVVVKILEVEPEVKKVSKKSKKTVE